MQRLEVSCTVRLIYVSLGVKGLMVNVVVFCVMVPCYIVVG